MQLPITLAEARKHWINFSNYLVRTRYALRNPETGEPLEYTFDEVLSRISKEFRSEEVQKSIRQMQFIVATPFLMNGGNPYTGRKGYYSCYPLGRVGDSTDEIFEMERDLVTIFQHAGGGGIDISGLRAKKALVDNGQGYASGPVSFAKGFSALSERISQGGKRRGALMIHGDYDIEDIEDFITFKAKEPGKYIGCNISINVTSEAFWNDEKLLQLIAECIWKSGDPGLLFTQRSLQNTPVPAKYNPVFSNPCGEYLSIAGTSCNLVSVNLYSALNCSYTEYLENVFGSSRISAIAANEILDLGGFPPIEHIKEATLKHRPIGIGFTGLHRAMNYFGTSYAHEEDAPKFTAQTQLALMLGSMQGSIQYGRENNIEPREWRMDYVDTLENRIHTEIERLPESVKEHWEKTASSIIATVREQGGLCNCVTTSQAPTGSTSQLLHVAATGLEPYFSIVQNRSIVDTDGNMKGYTLVPLEFYDKTSEELDLLDQETALKIDPYQQIRILAACQKFQHTAASKTVKLKPSTTVEDILELLQYVRNTDLKGISLFRDSSMTGVLSDGLKKPTEISFGDMPSHDGTTYRFSGPTTLRLTANRDAKDHTREIILQSTKSGSIIHGLCEALGRTISIGLQHDRQLLQKFATTLADISSEGMWNNKTLGRAYSIPSALSLLLYHVLETEDASDVEDVPEESTMILCPGCGRLSVKRNGACHSCTLCDYSSCN